MAKFKEVNPKQNFPELEREILSFWQENKIFEKSIDKNKNKEKFVFYEGPPTANGKPGIHHMLSRSFKDIIPRYKTMKGYLVRRRAGWDTHGLPVEIQVEKELGISGKKDIEEYGIENFNKKCKESVWKFKEDWEKMTERMGFWVDLENAYVTYKNEYIEKVWSILKKIWDKGLIYKGHKSVPWCPRCETTLSSHEVAQGYQLIEDESVFIKFPMEGKENAYFLVWTTTPWTLPGNIALAVGENIDYVEVEQGGETLILAKDLAQKILGDSAKVVKELKGKDLIGLKYQNLYDNSGFIKNKSDKDFQVWGAGFVATDEGTGIVHIAPAFGEDDLNLQKENGFSIPVTMDSDGSMLFEIGQGKFVKEADSDIKADLKDRGLLFKETRIKHEYPFCWRCDTPLIYFARSSWFIEMSKLRKELEQNNASINWVPEYIKIGRFGSWLKDAKDWALSRQRYWGTPLPIWECKCGEKQMVGSIDELKEKSNQSITRITVLRHGESEKNVKNINSHSMDKFPLTRKGAQTAEQLSERIDNFDLIISSPILRAKQTARIINQKLKTKIIYDERISELNFGKWNDIPKDELIKNDKSYIEYRRINNLEEKFDYHMGETGESRKDVIERTKSFLSDIVKKCPGKNILIVGHGETNAAINKILQDISLEEYWEREDIGHNHLDSFLLGNDGKLFDLHKPYIDEVKVKCSKCGGEAHRVKDVIDVWFDAGSMPFATDEYPENYPADYISEAIDQTRGWFYTLLAIATLLSEKAPYKNVICLGHVLDEQGKKMSKSRGNIIDPMLMMDKYGADAVRWLFYTVNGPGDSKRVGEKNIQEAFRKFVLLLWNVYGFFVTYADVDGWSPDKTENSDEILDKWIISEKSLLIQKVEKSLEDYDIVGAARLIQEFNNNLSTWYLRQSRKRRDRKFYSTLYKVLLDLAKISAPFIPFTAENIYQNLKSDQDPESVHLCDWPKADDNSIDQKLVGQMDLLRKVVEIGHSIRASKGIKLRQPLRAVWVNKEIDDQLKDLICSELNVKQLEEKSFAGEEKEIAGIKVVLDAQLNDELISEGMIRDLIREIQQARKEAGFTPKDLLKAGFKADERLSNLIEENKKEFLESCNLSDLVESDQKGEFEKELKINDLKVHITLSK